MADAKQMSTVRLTRKTLGRRGSEEGMQGKPGCESFQGGRRGGRGEIGTKMLDESYLDKFSFQWQPALVQKLKPSSLVTDGHQVGAALAGAAWDRLQLNSDKAERPGPRIESPLRRLVESEERKHGVWLLVAVSRRTQRLLDGLLFLQRKGNN